MATSLRKKKERARKKAPSDLCLFPLLTEHLRGTQFSSDSDVIESVEDFLKEQDELFYTTGVQKLQKR